MIQVDQYLSDTNDNLSTRRLESRLVATKHGHIRRQRY